VSVDGTPWQLDQGFLAGRVVTVARSLVHPAEAPWVEHNGKRLPLFPIDPVANARRPRPPRGPDDRRAGAPGGTAVPFDPPGALLDRAAGRKPRHARDDDEVQ
jgi:putative transposase